MKFDESSLKAENTDDLCASCHKELSSNFMHTGHSDQGLACIDCHMSELSPTGEHGISKRDHTFFVDLESCTKCHGGEMHNAAASGVEAVAEEAHQAESKPVDAMAAVEALPVSASPSPVSPLGFTVLAGLVGIAFGIILAPWIDQLRRRERS